MLKLIDMLELGVVGKREVGMWDTGGEVCGCVGGGGGGPW